MTSFRPIDSKREEFRKYLERSGVLDELTKIFVALYEETEKPEDALEYVRHSLVDKTPPVAELESLKTELNDAMARIKELELENAYLKGEGQPQVTSTTDFNSEMPQNEADDEKEDTKENEKEEITNEVKL